jgi:hypothetical protein
MNGVIVKMKVEIILLHTLDVLYGVGKAMMNLCTYDIKIV